MMKKFYCIVNLCLTVILCKTKHNRLIITTVGEANIIHDYFKNLDIISPDVYWLLNVRIFWVKLRLSTL